MRLPLKLCAVVFAACCICMATVLTVARLTHFDPLARYAAIMPGRSVDMVKRYPCTLQTGTRKGQEMGFCDFDASDQVFGRITVIETNRIITSLTLVVLPGRLMIGNLILCWGEPVWLRPNEPDSGAANLHAHWGSGIDVSVISTDDANPAENFLPLEILHFRGEAPSCRPA